MSFRRRSRLAGTTAVAAVSLVLYARRVREPEPVLAEPPFRSSSVAPRPSSPEPLVGLHPAAAAQLAIPTDLAVGLEPSDLEWVQREAERYRAARGLSPEQTQEVARQLAMIRKFDVLERQEPLAAQEVP